jgi:hypothetical protein
MSEPSVNADRLGPWSTGAGQHNHQLDGMSEHLGRWDMFVKHSAPFIYLFFAGISVSILQGCSDKPIAYDSIEVKWYHRCDMPPIWARDNVPSPPGVTEEQRRRVLEESLVGGYELINRGGSTLKDVALTLSLTADDGAKQSQDTVADEWKPGTSLFVSLEPSQWRQYVRIVLDGTASADDKRVGIRGTFVRQRGVHHEAWTRE